MSHYESWMEGLLWQAEDPLADFGLHASFTADQRAYRFRNDDGNEANATWKAAENTPIDQVIGEIFRLRIAVQEIAGGSGNNRTIVLQSNINGAGWFDVGPSTNGVRLGQSHHVADQTLTTRQLTGTSGTFIPGLLLTETSGTDISFNGNDHTEVEWASLLITGDVPTGATVNFRTTVNGSVTDTVTASPSLTATAPLPTPPTQQPELSVLNTTTTNIAIESTTVDGDEYEFQRKLTSEGTFTTTQHTSSTTVNDVGLLNNTSYDYRVRATNVDGEGPWSSVLTVSTNELGAPLLSLVDSGEDFIELSWSPVSEATSYELQRDSSTIATTTTNLTHIDDGLSPDTQYQYRVRAVNSGGPGPWSNTITASTDEPPPPPPWSELEEFSSTDTQHVDTTVTPGWYRYRVAEASDGSPVTSYSEWIIVQVEETDGQPTGLMAKSGVLRVKNGILRTKS